MGSSSMFFPTKADDKKFQLELIELIQLLVKVGTTQSLDLAEKFGDHYTELEEKIKTHNYEPDDERFYQLESIVKWNMPTKDTSPSNTQSQESQFRQWQQANGVNRQQKSWSSPQAVISGRYGLSVETFLKNNTLGDNRKTT